MISEPTPSSSWVVSPERRAEIAELARSMSLRAVAERCGVSDRTVANIKREFGIAPNPRGVAPFFGRKFWATGHKHWPCRPMAGLNPGGIRL